MRLDFGVEPQRSSPYSDEAGRSAESGCLVRPRRARITFQPFRALDDWRRRWPRHPLPRDLAFLVSRYNGLHLWANLETGRSYEGIAPIEVWDLARNVIDGAACVVVDVDTVRYFYMDACGADTSCVIGDSVDGLLDWLWKHRIPW